MSTSATVAGPVVPLQADHDVATAEPAALEQVEDKDEDDEDEIADGDEDAEDAPDQEADNPDGDDVMGQTSGAPEQNAQPSVPAPVDTALQYPTIETAMAPSVGECSNARDLDADEWHEVLQINKLLHGYFIRDDNEDVVRARRSAFELTGPITRSKRTKRLLQRKPEFSVEDGLSIQVFETKNNFQRSLARNGFSKRCIDANLCAGAFGFMAGGGVQRERGGSEAVSSTVVSQDQEYFAVYNFPRARVILDEYELQITEGCRQELLNIESQRTLGALERFYKLYGHVFVTSVLLGGQQKTSKLAAALQHMDSQKQQEALRSAFGVKIDAQYLSTDSKFSKEQGSDGTRDDQKYTDLSYLGMSATGGHTLIGSDVPNWAGTVAPYKNWRVIKHEIAEPIYELIGKMSGWEHIPQLIKSINDPKLSEIQKPLVFWGHFSLLHNGEPLYWSGKEKFGDLCPLSSCPSHLPKRKAVFVMLDKSDLSEPGRMTQFCADHPMSLCSFGPSDTVVSYACTLRRRDPSDYYLIGHVPGLYWGPVFSFRAENDYGPWNPERRPRKLLRSGDRVRLYCHSLGLGPFGSLYRPPSYAVPAQINEGVQAASVFFTAPQRYLTPSIQSLTLAYDRLDFREVTSQDRKAFEEMGFISDETFSIPSGDKGQIPQISAGVNIGFAGATATRTFERGQPSRGPTKKMDYKKWQKESKKSSPAVWEAARREYMGNIANMDGAVFTLVFESDAQ